MKPNNRPLRVLFLETGETGTGGSFESLFQQVSALDRSRVEPVVALLNDSWCRQALLEREIPCVLLENHWYAKARAGSRTRSLVFRIASVLDRIGGAPRYDRLIHASLIRRVKSLCQEHAIDLVHLNTQVHRDYFAAYAASDEGLPVVSHLRSYPTRLGRGKAREANRRVRRFLAISEGVKQHWTSLGLDADRITVLPNALPEVSAEPLDLADAMGVDTSQPIVGALGRMVPQRHLDWLIRGFEQVLEQHPTAQLVIVGDGEPLASYRELASQLGISGQVHFPGYDARGKAFLAALDVFVMCRSIDPYGRVLLEAWEFGVPVVTARVEPTGDRLQHDQNVLFYPPGDAPELGRQVARVLDDPALAACLRESGKQTLEAHFRMSGYQERLLQTYDEILAVHDR